jgi:hypothetical protein
MKRVEGKSSQREERLMTQKLHPAAFIAKVLADADREHRSLTGEPLPNAIVRSVVDSLAKGLHTQRPICQPICIPAREDDRPGTWYVNAEYRGRTVSIRTTDRVAANRISSALNSIGA